MLNRCGFWGKKGHFCGEIIIFGWWMITFEGPQGMWTNPSKKSRQGPDPIQVVPVFWERMVGHSIPKFGLEDKAWPIGHGLHCIRFNWTKIRGSTWMAVAGCQGTDFWWKASSSSSTIVSIVSKLFVSTSFLLLLCFCCPQWQKGELAETWVNCMHSFLLKWVSMKEMAVILFFWLSTAACRVFIDFRDNPILFLWRTHCWSFSGRFLLLFSSLMEMI